MPPHVPAPETVRNESDLSARLPASSHYDTARLRVRLLHLDWCVPPASCAEIPHRYPLYQVFPNKALPH